MKKILIVARPEGASGLTWANKINLEVGYKSLASDVNEVARAIRDSGYIPVTYTPIAACHIYNWLHVPFLDDVKQLSEEELYAQMNEIFAVVLVGVTAKAGTLNAFMDATYNPVGWHDYYLNGKCIGEIGMYKNYFANFNVPIIFSCGDVASCLEAEQEMQGIKTVALKKAKCCNVATYIEGSKEKLYGTVLEAIKNPIKVSEKPTFPLTKRIVLTRTEYCADSVRWFPDGVNRIDGRTVEYKLDELKYFTDLV